MARYFVVAKGTKSLPLSGGYLWPYEVSLCFERVSHPVGFSESVGHGAAGGIFTAQEALQTKWTEHIASAGGDWLLPYIQLLASGESLDRDLILTIATERMGGGLESYEHIDA